MGGSRVCSLSILTSRIVIAAGPSGRRLICSRYLFPSVDTSRIWRRSLKSGTSDDLVLGHCDLDILLDPIFLHFPRPNEVKTWYPGLSEGRTDIPTLVTALSMGDEAEPWKNQFRFSISDHDPTTSRQILSVQSKFWCLRISILQYDSLHLFFYLNRQSSIRTPSIRKSSI